MFGQHRVKELYEEIKSLNDEDLNAIVAFTHRHHQERRLPKVEVTFQGISGEVILGPVMLQPSMILSDLQRLVQQSLDIRIDEFQLICEGRVLESCDSLAVLGESTCKVLQVIKCYRKIVLLGEMRKINWTHLVNMLNRWNCWIQLSMTIAHESCMKFRCCLQATDFLFRCWLQELLLPSVLLCFKKLAMCSDLAGWAIQWRTCPMYGGHICNLIWLW